MGLLLLWALALVPARPAGAEHLLQLPLEVPLVALILALAPVSIGRVVAAVIAVVAVWLAMLQAADLGMRLAFRRPFDPVLDLYVIRPAWELATGTFGTVTTFVVVLAVVVAIILIGWACYRALASLSRHSGRRSAMAAGVFLGLGLLVPVGGFTLLPEVPQRAERFARSLREESEFVRDLGRRETAEAPDFAALEGRDVYLLFVESYGQSWLQEDLYRDDALERLTAVESRLGDAGFSMRSAWLTSPTQGGQSWLAHATALSGLWVSSQRRYDALIGSQRTSLNRQFRAAGWQTLAVMPAISRDWPEARWYGYDDLRDKERMEYRGLPFEWVTMPDQYTLSRTTDLVSEMDGPVMVEAALITSHAPWTPLPDILPWEDIGDGSIYDGSHREGGTPAEVWDDYDDVRVAYGKTLDYSLEIIGQWVERSADDSLVVVLGDHQPAPLIAGEEAGAAVPVHVISRDPDLLEMLPGAWTPGLLPDPELAERPMTDLRGILSSCMSSLGCDDTQLAENY
ncbi:sulfatase [Pelagovum pacificum]|uniref:Sulfatase n=1 Tax=Pelagovum pacificum TaxID=2588711 RepID=A0A5C5GG48_9RHOB|nr:sulfatase [Pelagovum pacificum]QQA43119.1 sulfatase [Pelagovum pacificum]TNY33738.1 sulfatase [Pelagovum pacificum]